MPGLPAADHRRSRIRRCPIDAQERYDRFCSALGFRADLTDAPGLEIAALDGEPVHPAVRLHVDPTSLASHLPQHPVDAGDAGDADDLEAARLQSLLAQIEEAILVREPGRDDLVLVDGGVRAVPADQV